ncbi:MAG: phosphatidylserine decarboxylase [Elusimicrobiota bacterium]|nr:phosphatidylserine decarboxylase [Elusimicrobiota bacterium]
MTPAIVAHQPIVSELIAFLESRPDLEAALKESIHEADRPDVSTLAEYLAFLDEMVVLIPRDRELNAYILKFYYLINLSPGGILQADKGFLAWTRKFAKDWGAFLDTPESAAGLDSFRANPAYRIGDYLEAPGGWKTFNRFFAREVRPGMRPVDDAGDDNVFVSPADSVYQGRWPIAEHSTITVKGWKWSLLELLTGSPYQDRFRGGTFVHGFLDVNDYHRFHAPAAGTVLEARKIPGNVAMDVVKKADGTLGMVDGTGHQFTQDRGLVVIDSPLGLVAVLPVGMAQVSSVNLTVKAGATLAKGAELGFFAFGGSDIVLLFEAGKIRMDAKIGTHYDQGRKIGHAVNG